MAQKKQKNNGAVEKKLVGVADVVITAAQRSKDPTLSIPVRSLANVNFNEKRGIIEMGRAQAGAHILQRRHGQEVHADGAGGRRPRRAAAGRI